MNLWDGQKSDVLLDSYTLILKRMQDWLTLLFWTWRYFKIIFITLDSFPGTISVRFSELCTFW